jgi:MvdD-like protein with pre-ATP grasp domain
MSPSILIVTAPHDEPAKRVEQELRRRGAEVSRLDYADFPSAARVSVEFDDARGELQLRLRERRIDLRRLEGIWYRKPGAPSASCNIADPVVRELVENDCVDFLTSLWDLAGCRALPGRPSLMINSQRKAPQLQRARALGFDMQRYVGDDFCRYTEVVSTRDVAYAQSVAHCPIIFQAYVPKRLELRITVVGTRVFAAEIHSQATNRTAHDYRRYDLNATPHRIHELPEQVAQRCVRLVQDLGLLYGAIDMILTPDGRYVFLEINPSGEYGWIEDLTGMPISAAIAEVLLGTSLSAETLHA